MSDSNHIQVWFADRDPVDARAFSVHEVASGLFAITVDVTSRDHDLAFDSLVDAGVVLKLEQIGVVDRVWSGICAQISHVSTQESGESIYRVHIVPELWRLSLRKNSRIFQDKSLPEIVVRVLNDWGIEPMCRNLKLDDYAQYPQYEYRVQYEESDLAFICRLLEECGITWHFEFANETSGKARDLTVLVLDPHPHRAGHESGPKPLRGPLPYLGHMEESHFRFSGPGVANASMARGLRPGSVVERDHEFMRALGARVQGAAEVDSPENKYESFEYAPGVMRATKAGDVFLPSLANHFAQARLRALRADMLVATFRTNVLDITAGTVVSFDMGGGARPELSQQPLLVIATELHGTTDGQWFSTCTAVPADGEYGPPRITPKPRIDGVQSAFVVGDERAVKEEIHTDRFGRVKVQFHWDRQHLYGEPVAGEEKILASRWIRVGTLWAGPGYGSIAVPRVGHEVLVAFLDGDPDQPVIVGSVHNGLNVPPYQPLPQHNRRTGLRTSSSSGGKGFNELFFDDSKNQEQISIQAQAALSTIVKAAESLDVGASRTTTIGASDELHVGEKWEVAAGKNETGIRVHENKLINIQVNGANGAQALLSGTGMFLNAKQEIHFHAGADIHLSAEGKIQIDSNAPQQLVHINDEGRSPDEVELPGFANAQSPQRGATIDATTKPTGQRSAPAAPGPIARDVSFDPPPEPERERTEADEGGEERPATRGLRQGDPDFARDAIVSGLSGRDIDPAVIQRDINARYGQYASDAVPRDVPINVLAPDRYQEVRQAYGVSANTAAFYALPSETNPSGAIFLQQGARPDYVYHEILHSRTDPRFMQWASPGENTAFEEAATQLLTRRSLAGTGIVPASTTYDQGVARIERLRLPEGVLERAYFGGDTGPLDRAIQQRTGRPASEFFQQLDRLERTPPPPPRGR